MGRLARVTSGDVQSVARRYVAPLFAPPKSFSYPPVRLAVSTRPGNVDAIVGGLTSHGFSVERVDFDEEASKRKPLI